MMITIPVFFFVMAIILAITTKPRWMMTVEEREESSRQNRKLALMLGILSLPVVLIFAVIISNTGDFNMGKDDNSYSSSPSGETPPQSPPINVNNTNDYQLEREQDNYLQQRIENQLQRCKEDYRIYQQSNSEDDQDVFQEDYSEYQEMVQELQQRQSQENNHTLPF